MSTPNQDEYPGYDWVEIGPDGPVIEQTDFEYRELPPVFEDHINDHQE